jgi:hypothetical protein
VIIESVRSKTNERIASKRLSCLKIERNVCNAFFIMLETEKFMLFRDLKRAKKSPLTNDKKVELNSNAANYSW